LSVEQFLFYMDTFSCKLYIFSYSAFELQVCLINSVVS